MKKYDYSFLRSLSVPVNFLNMTNAIYTLRTVEENKKESYPDIFTALKKIAIVQSVKSSNAIEGIVTTDRRIEDIVERSSAPLNHNEEEIAGYRDALNLIHSHYSELSVNEETILTLHRILLSKTAVGYGGRYKSENNVITEILADGTNSIRWTPVSAIETPSAMRDLINAFMEARDDASINQLLLIPCFILDFLCIHPFRDGNGRMSRLLSLLLLYRAGFDIPMYVSFEEQINSRKSQYYKALKESSAGWHDNRNDYIPFTEDFLYTLYLCYKELDRRFPTLGSRKAGKKERVENTVLSSIIPLSKREIMDILPDVSMTTVEEVLATMVRDGKIERIGNTRNARYLKKQESL
jgi:Fic family protein